MAHLALLGASYPRGQKLTVKRACLSRHTLRAHLAAVRCPPKAIPPRRRGKLLPTSQRSRPSCVGSPLIARSCERVKPNIAVSIPDKALPAPGRVEGSDDTGPDSRLIGPVSGSGLHVTVTRWPRALHRLAPVAGRASSAAEWLRSGSPPGREPGRDGLFGGVSAASVCNFMMARPPASPATRPASGPRSYRSRERDRSAAASISASAWKSPLPGPMRSSDERSGVLDGDFPCVCAARPLARYKVRPGGTRRSGPFSCSCSLRSSMFSSVHWVFSGAALRPSLEGLAREVRVKPRASPAPRRRSRAARTARGSLGLLFLRGGSRPAARGRGR